jgi:hypothetical protein
MSNFPIDLGAYQRITLDPSINTLTAQQRDSLKANIQLCRDAIVFFTATGAARGVVDIPAALTIPCRKS